MRRQLAWKILILWFGFCTYFVFAGGITEGGGWPALVRVFVFLVVFGVGAVIAWYRPQQASLLLFLTSIILVAAILFGAKNNRLFLLVTMALPPFVAAKLLQEQPAP